MRSVLPVKLFALLASLVASLAVATGASAAPAAAIVDSRIEAFAPPGYIGGPYQTGAGETIRVFSSPAYAADTGFNQRWVDFITAMPHGSEVSQVTFYFGPLTDVRTACGPRTLACYSPRDAVIFSTAEDIADRATAQSILLHEYGHHIALNRDNSPWAAIDYGTKRWASYMNVCRGEQQGLLFPGDEGDHYRLNPGEAFAEAYRVWAEKRLGIVEAAWGAVSSGLYPDAAALAALEQDVLDPWVGPTAKTVSSSFRPYAGTSRKFGIATPLDGVMRVTLRAPAGTGFALKLYDATGTKILATPGTGTARVKELTFQICGHRTLLARVERQKGFGSFTVTISKP